MRVRVYFRDTAVIPNADCAGSRLRLPPFWKWKSFTLPTYILPVDICSRISRVPVREPPKRPSHRKHKIGLGYLQAVGLGYLTLDRSARSLSGGETQRVNLTACLGSSLTDTHHKLDSQRSAFTVKASKSS